MVEKKMENNYEYYKEFKTQFDARTAYNSNIYY